MNKGVFVLFWDIFLGAIVLLVGQSSLASLKSTFQAEGLGFVSENFNNTTSSQFSLIGMSLKSVHSENDFLKVNLSGAYAVGYPQMSYLNIKEFFINTKIESSPTGGSQLLFGRRLHLWSEAEQEWNLGVFQPQFRWNPIRPTQQGLTGIFWQKKESSWGLMVFGSPFFIPDQGSSYELKDGQFQQTSPWFKNPPRNLNFYGESLPIEYDVQAPDLSDVVYQQSYGVQFEIGEEKGFYSRVSGQYRPSNQMALGYQASVVSAVNLSVEVIPKTYYENVVGFDSGWKNENHHLSLSLIQSRPHDVEFSADFTKPFFKESNIASLGYAMTNRLTQLEVRSKINYLKTTNDTVVDVGPDASESRGSLSWKYLFTDAGRLATSVKYFVSKNLIWTSELIWTQAFDSKYRQLDFSNKIDFRGPWSVSFNLHFVESESEKSPTYIFKNLDQVWIGAGYEF